MTVYLADTHVALWLLNEPERLSARHRDILFSDHKRLISIASIWEMSIKAGLGKLDVPAGLADTLMASGFDLLAIAPAHAEAVRHLPRHHADPFDRMLIAQAQTDGLTLMTQDRRFAAYEVARV